MPILYNPAKNVRSIILQDGSMRSIGGKKRFYVKPEEMSGQIVALITSKQLFDKGGDPTVMVESVELVSGPKDTGVIVMATSGSKDGEVIVGIMQNPPQNISSDIHPEHDIDSDIKDLEEAKETEESVKVNRKKKKKDLEE